MNWNSSSTAATKVTPQAGGFSTRLLQGQHEGGEAAFVVDGAAPVEASVPQHRLERVDRHARDLHGVEVRLPEEMPTARPALEARDHIGPARQNRVDLDVEADPPKPFGDIVGERRLAEPMLGLAVAAERRIDAGDGDHLAEQRDDFGFRYAHPAALRTPWRLIIADSFRSDRA